MKGITIATCDAELMSRTSVELAAVHQAAFGESHEQAKRYRDESIPDMSRYSGIRCLTARCDGRLVGFVLGYDAVAKPDWFDNVSRAVSGTSTALWLPHAWYLADIAVHPDVQRQGVGTILHNRIIQDVSGQPLVLITFHGDHPAKRFYKRLGWQELIPDLLYRPGAPLTSLMGRRL